MVLSKPILLLVIYLSFIINYNEALEEVVDEKLIQVINVLYKNNKEVAVKVERK